MAWGLVHWLHNLFAKIAKVQSKWTFHLAYNGGLPITKFFWIETGWRRGCVEGGSQSARKIWPCAQMFQSLVCFLNNFLHFPGGTGLIWEGNITHVIPHWVSTFTFCSLLPLLWIYWLDQKMRHMVWPWKKVKLSLLQKSCMFSRAVATRDCVLCRCLVSACADTHSSIPKDSLNFLLFFKNHICS